MSVLAASNWSSNAELIADCAQLGYLTRAGRALDPTYGHGNWWKVWRPLLLVRHDIAADGVDFRELPHDDEEFLHVAFDPPYVSVGGRKTTTMPDFYERYGMTDAPRTPAQLQVMINSGLDEMYRVLKPRGTLLCKCADYVSSGKLWIGTHHTLTHGLSLGLELIDRFEHIGVPRPQPPRTRADGKTVVQQHARRNLSTLLVFRKS